MNSKPAWSTCRSTYHRYYNEWMACFSEGDGSFERPHLVSDLAAIPGRGKDSCPRCGGQVFHAEKMLSKKNVSPAKKETFLTTFLKRIPLVRGLRCSTSNASPASSVAVLWTPPPAATAPTGRSTASSATASSSVPRATGTGAPGPCRHCWPRADPRRSSNTTWTRGYSEYSTVALPVVERSDPLHTRLGSTSCPPCASPRPSSRTAARGADTPSTRPRSWWRPSG